MKELRDEILANPDAKDAYAEADLRRMISERVCAAMKLQGVSRFELERRMGSSRAQVQRLLDEPRGGSLLLITLVQAAHALNMPVAALINKLAVPQP